MFINRVRAGDIAGSFEQAIFILIVQGLIYGNFLYQLTRLGYLRRRLGHVPTSPQVREASYADDAPALTILVPSYKEELATIERTLLSAALQDYPKRRIVLLLDDQPSGSDLKAHRALDAARGLPIRLQAAFDMAARPFTDACAAFSSRLEQGFIDQVAESANIARLYIQAAGWLESLAARHAVTDHCDNLLIDQVLLRAARAHRVRARTARQQSPLASTQIQREYEHLATLFQVELSSFQRKRYVNLSHEPNKAMNLNSYIGLLGRSWRGVNRPDGIHLEPVPAGPDTLEVPAADFLITLDANSILVPEYASLLVHHMRGPGNERVAVVQTPYNTVPAAPGLLERIAGATTDIQYLMHQGFTHYDATYWVGANALLRVSALNDIKHCVHERGFEVTAFIQDRTVIEDTESTVDLVACGWRLYNYPERLAYSATPSDFGSLLIQRCRWANGGLIILPKLLRYLISPPLSLGKVIEGFFRVHYLGSIAAVNLGLLILLGHSFETSTQSISLLILTSVPYFVLYARDLRYSGYHINDLVRIYALNLLLLPVNLTGVFKSLQQAITGRRIPFARTPKVSGRITVPVQFVLAEYALLLSWLAGFGIDLHGGRWISASFCLANALLLAYAIGQFVGWRASWEDIRLGSPWPVKATNRLLTLTLKTESANDHAIVHFERKEHRQVMPEHAMSLEKRAALRECKR